MAGYDLHTAHIDDPIERIFGLLDGYRKMLMSCDFDVGCPIGNLALELANSHPAVRPLLLVNFEQWVDSVEGFLDAAADRLPADLDRRGLAFHILTTMEGGVLLARTYIDALLHAGTHWSRVRSLPRRRAQS